GQSALGFDETVTPVERVQALIDRAVRDARSSARPDPERLLDQAFLLGIAWGQTLVRHRGWRWEMLVAATGEEALAVVRPDRGLAVPVLVYLKRLVAAPAADATTWLTFNMITDGRFDAPAGALSLIN
ncbi:MAG: hypothetical protein JWO31_3040, partial [Phycisphaerales bacterium]|nr:hypothetical protein [Phycisphaerales bacterium]